jgi:hypothetical protein
MFLKTSTVSCSSHRLFLFCVICVYMSLLIFRHTWCFHSSFLALCFTVYFLGYNFTRCTFSTNLDLFSGPVVFPVGCILWYI